MKPKGQDIYRQYPPLLDIAEDEWDEIFDRQGHYWTPSEDRYIKHWYANDDALNIGYALGRTPQSVKYRARVLRVEEE